MQNRTSRALLMVGAAAVAAASIATEALAQQAPAPAATPPAAATPPTPRMPDGHPDLTGLWVGGASFNVGADSLVFNGRGGTYQGYESDGGVLRTAVVNRNVPKYKPEHWDQLIANEYNGNWEDPGNSCMPPGVPRLGAPSQIFSLKDQPLVILMYAGPPRIIPLDGRPHNAARVANESWNGDPVGHWEGDTLVIETIGFTDASWLHKSGYMHGFNMKVTERITRTGNTLNWVATVEDPDYLLEPWTLDPITRRLNPDPLAVMLDPLPCIDRDRDLSTSHTRSGNTG